MAIGGNPTVNWLNYDPQSADPTSPNEGDVFYSNGTPRTEGLWVYINGAWAQVSTSVASSVFTSITLTPQAADPGSPVTGMVFYSNGTPRAAGIWTYNGTGWVQLTGVTSQEFNLKDIVEVRVASTGALTLSSQVENGDTIDGIVLATGNVVLIKNQVTASENGVYTVNTSGAPTRHSSADTAAELNNGYTAYVQQGTTNKKTLWYQTATLTTLADSQVWSSSAPAAFTFTVPAGVYSLDVLANGAGGGGGGGGSGTVSGNSQALAGSAGAGGSGSAPATVQLSVTPGEVVTINIGTPGRKGNGGANPTTAVQARGSGSDGTAGGTTVITSLSKTISVPGGAAGEGGLTGQDENDALTVGNASAISSPPHMTVGSGDGGHPNAGTNTSLAGCKGTDGTDTVYANGGDGGLSGIFVSGGGRGGGGGGGGGAGLGKGGTGGVGRNGNLITTTQADAPDDASLGGGGGGGGGSGSPASSGGIVGGNGGHGKSGYVRLSW